MMSDTGAQAQSHRGDMPSWLALTIVGLVMAAALIAYVVFVLVKEHGWYDVLRHGLQYLLSESFGIGGGGGASGAGSAGK